MRVAMSVSVIHWLLGDSPTSAVCDAVSIRENQTTRLFQCGGTMTSSPKTRNGIYVCCCCSKGHAYKKKKVYICILLSHTHTHTGSAISYTFFVAVVRLDFVVFSYLRQPGKTRKTSSHSPDRVERSLTVFLSGGRKERKEMGMVHTLFKPSATC